MLVMEELLPAMIGFVGALLCALLMWIRSDLKELKTDIKSINVTLVEHGERLARIETGHGDRLARIETLLGVPPSPPEPPATEPPIPA